MSRTGESAESRATSRAGLVSVAAGLAVLALKGWAAWRSGSVALLADAAESAVNVVATLVAAVSWSSSASTLEGHAPFGHGRMEYLSAAIEGALVAVAALVVAFEAIVRYGEAPALPALGTALAVSLAATAGTAALARHLGTIGRRHRSPEALVEALRQRADVRIALAVYAGLAVAWAGGWWALDALLAIGVSVHILVAGLRAVRHSVSGWLDEALPLDEISVLEARLRDEGPPVLAFRELHARRAGSQVFVEFHLLLNRYALLHEAHAICDRLRADLALLVPGARVTIHVEPESGGPAGAEPGMTL